MPQQSQTPCAKRESNRDFLRAHDDTLTLTGALIWRAWIATFRGDYDQAERDLEEALGQANQEPITTPTRDFHLD